jgi:hypothetical protein
MTLIDTASGTTEGSEVERRVGGGVSPETTFGKEKNVGKWAELADKLRERDKNSLEDMNSYSGGGPTIENRIALADGRATDALVTLLQVLAYLDAHDETPNVK